MDWVSDGSEEPHPRWNLPGSVDEINHIWQANSGTHIIYKHSFSCGISYMTKSNLERKIEDLADKAQLHFIDVIEARPVSDLIAEKSGVAHHSPQVIVIRNGEVIWDASHGSIKPELLLKTI